MAYTIKSGDTLSGIATANKTNIQDLLKLNPTITNPNVIQAGASLNLTAPPVNPTVPSSTDATTIGNSPTFAAPDPTSNTDTTTPFVSSLKTITDNFSNAYTEASKATQPIQQERNSLTEKLTQAFDNLGGRTKAQTTAEQAQGIPQKVQQLQDLNLSISQKTGEYDKAIASLEGQGRGITADIVTGQQGAINRQKVAEISALSSVAAALQGNLTLSYDLANRSVDLEFKDKEDKIKSLTTLLDLNQDSLTSAEKKQADQLKFTLDKQQAEVDAAKEERKQILNLATEAAKQGASNEVLNKLTKATNLDDAFSIGGSALGNEYKNKLIQQAFDNSIETQKVAIARMQAAKSGSGGGGGKTSTVTQAVIDNPALFSNLTPTVKGQVIAELQANGYDTTNLGAKALSDGAIKEISQTQGGIDSLVELKTLINGNIDKLGPVTGLQRLNPYSESKKLQANVDLVRQKVGKALEGGVLRKEDEAKYKQILATLNDTPSTAIYKVDSLISTLQRDIETYTSLQQSSGRSTDVNAGLTKKGAITNFGTDLRKKYNY